MLSALTPLSLGKLSSTTGKVLLLLDSKEREMFFPGGFTLPGVEIIDDRGAPAANLLRELSPEVVVTSWSTPAFQEETLQENPSLRYICHTAGSVRHIIPRSFIENGILVTNWGALAAQSVAEHALLLVLSGLRDSTGWASVIAGEKEWQPSPIRTLTLFGKRVGLHGFGNVARALIPLFRPFEVTLMGYSHGVPPEMFLEQNVYQCQSLEELFANSDIVVDCEALNPHTQGSVNRSVLEKMIAGALFVNVGRGGVVDELALAELVQSGRIRAALDVFETDPISPDSPLHKAPGVVMSPHIAGPTADQLARFGDLALQNVSAFFHNQPLTAKVTLEIYDRAT